ncbi:MAG: Ldh family oxidoreductase [Burkholderiales bacterium]
MIANTSARISATELKAFAKRAYLAVGFSETDAATVADLMAQADLYGADGHGVFRLPQYIRRIKAGGVNKTPNIRVLRETVATALIDGDNAMGHLVMKRAAELAVEKARTAGIGWVGARLSNHAGPALLYARIPMAADMIGLYLAVGNANHLAPWGGIDMLLSTNPIAVAVPTLEEPPIVLDMATTVAAYGKVKTAAQRGETMPVGWMIDRLGNPLTDPNRADEGILLPIGGYKGYGLSLIIGLLAGTLNGAAMGRDVVDFNADDKATTNTGQAVMAISIDAFGDRTEFKRKVDAVARDIRNSKRLPSYDRIWLPGEQSAAKRVDREKNGVPIPPQLMASLQKLAGSLGIEPLGFRAADRADS